MYRVASMFAGIGGICRAFKEAGMSITWANEIDKYACQSYRYNFGDDYLAEGDIKNIFTEDVPDFDILTSGFPCQAFSIAGNRKGFSDERGNLFFETLRFINEKKPKAFLIENVKNLYKHDNGRTFAVIKESLEESGYHLKYKVLNTMDYGNVPQNRERIYIVGFRDQVACAAFEFPTPVPLEKEISDLINFSDKKDEKYYYTESSPYFPMIDEAIKKRDTVYQLRRIYVRENKSGVCPTLTANMGTGGHNVPLIIDDFGYRKLTPEECFRFQGFGEFKIDPKVSNAQLYKQAGNSVSVPVVKRIAENIASALNQAKGECAELSVKSEYIPSLISGNKKIAI